MSSIALPGTLEVRTHHSNSCKMAAMNAIARNYTEALLTHHRRVCWPVSEEAAQITDATVRRCCLTYLDLFRLSSGTMPRFMGRFLDDVARWCQNNRWPCLDSLVVNRKSGKPGDGYKTLHAGGLASWEKEVRLCIAFKKYPATTCESQFF